MRFINSNQFEKRTSFEAAYSSVGNVSSDKNETAQGAHIEKLPEVDQKMEQVFYATMFYMKNRFGFWKEKDPRLNMLQSIYDKLFPHYQIPKGRIIGIDIPEANAFVRLNKPNVYFFAGFLELFPEYCRQKKIPFTKDKIAFIIAHEMAHLEQGATGIVSEEELVKKEEKGGNFMERQKNKQQGINIEYDADRVALIRMARAGFNPREGVETLRFFQSLKDTCISSTHPRSNDRIRELQDFVESPDTIIPNINTPPSVIDIGTQEKYMRMFCHPGTQLYTQEGLSALEDLLDNKTSNIHDVIEIASVAVMYDIYAKVDRELRDIRVSKEMAKLIVLYNLYSIINTIIANIHCHRDSCGLPAVKKDYEMRIMHFSEPPDVLTRYIDSEFVFNHGQDNGLRERGKNFLLEQLRKETSGEYGVIQTIQSSVRGVRNWVETKKIKGLDAIIVKLEQICAIAEQIIQGDKIDLDIKQLIKNTRINFSNGKKIKDNQIINMELESLVSLAITDATKFFEDLQARMTIDNKSLKLHHSDDLAMRIVPKSIVGHEGLNTEKWREKIIHRLLLQFGVQKLLYRLTSSGASIGLAEQAERIKMGYSSHGHNDSVEGIYGWAEKLRPRIESYFVNYYKSFLSSVAALTLGKHLVKVFYFKTEPYDARELDKIVASLSEQDCIRVFRLLPRTFPSFTVTANELFVNDSGISNLFFGVEELPGKVHERFVKLVIERVRKEEIPAMTAEEEINFVIERLLLGELYEEKDIIMIVRRLNFNSLAVFNQLKRLFSAYKLFDMGLNDLIKIILERIDDLKQFKKPHELLKILINTDEKLAKAYVKRIWHAPRYRKLKQEEQELFLATVLEVLPGSGYMKESVKYQREYRDAYPGSYYHQILLEKMGLPNESELPKPLEYSISEEYLRLYRERHPDESFKEAIKLVLKNGGDIESCIQAFREYGDTSVGYNIATDINHPYHLSDSDLLEVAEYCTQIDRPIKEVYMRALAILNGKEYIYYGTHDTRNGWYYVREKDGSAQYEDLVESCFDTKKISLAENLKNIFRFVVRKKQIRQFKIYKDFQPSLQQQMIDALQKAYKLSATQTIKIGLHHYFDSIPRKICNRYEEFQYPFDQKEAATKYNPSDPSIFKRLKPIKIYHVAKSILMDKFFQESSLLVDSTLKPNERVKRINELIPESTDYRDEILVKAEEHMLHEYNFEFYKGQLRKTNKSVISLGDAQMLYAFYETAIPMVADAELQELWSIRADRIYHKYLKKETTDFDGEMKRICAIYPMASFARDSALLDLADSEIMKKPQQAERIALLLFANNRTTREEKDFIQQRKLEWINSLMILLNRRERKEYILWLIGVNKEPPLVARAFGGHNKRSVEDVPTAMFNLTPNERKEIFLRFLMGERGVLDPLTQDDTEQMLDFVEKLFNNIFPKESHSLDVNGRKLVRLAFINAFKLYTPYRRARLFIQMVEKMKARKNQTGVDDTKTGEQLKILLETLGPAAIKLGQVLSEERNSEGGYLLPKDIRSSLQKLKHEVDTFHKIASIQILAEQGEFQKSGIVTLDTMVGAASIKQVFTATTSDGDKVIEKVRRPSIVKYLEEDLRVMNEIVNILRDAGYNIPPNLLTRVRQLIAEEVDFEREVKNQRVFSLIVDEYNQKYNNRKFPITVPEIFNHSSEHIREEAIQGITIGDFMRFADGSIDPQNLKRKYSLSNEEVENFKKLSREIKDIRSRIVDFLLFQIFNKGAFHSDPHAGNIMISANGNISFIDLGSFAEIEREKISEVKKIIVGIYTGKDRSVIDGLKNFVSELSGEQIGKIRTILHTDGNLTQKLNLIANTLMTAETDPNFDKFLKTITTSQYLLKDIKSKITLSIFRHVIPNNRFVF